MNFIFEKTKAEANGKLKKCPFCGVEAELIIDRYENSDTTHLHSIKCKDTFACGARMNDTFSLFQPDYKELVEKFINRWNERVEDKTDEKSSEERLEAVVQELIDVAKQSETPSKVIKKVGENFLYIAAALEIIEEGER